MKITITTIGATGESNAFPELEIDASCTIADVKSHPQFATLGFSPECCRIIYSGRELKDTEKLSECCTNKQPVFHVVPRKGSTVKDLSSRIAQMSHATTQDFAALLERSTYASAEELSQNSYSDLAKHLLDSVTAEPNDDPIVFADRVADIPSSLAKCTITEDELAYLQAPAKAPKNLDNALAAIENRIAQLDPVWAGHVRAYCDEVKKTVEILANVHNQDAQDTVVCLMCEFYSGIAELLGTQSLESALMEPSKAFAAQLERLNTMKDQFTAKQTEIQGLEMKEKTTELLQCYKEAMASCNAKFTTIAEDYVRNGQFQDQSSIRSSLLSSALDLVKKLKARIEIITKETGLLEEGVAELNTTYEGITASVLEDIDRLNAEKISLEKQGERHFAMVMALIVAEGRRKMLYNRTTETITQATAQMEQLASVYSAENEKATTRSTLLNSAIADNHEYVAAVDSIQCASSTLIEKIEQCIATRKEYHYNQSINTNIEQYKLFMEAFRMAFMERSGAELNLNEELAKQRMYDEKIGLAVRRRQHAKVEKLTQKKASSNERIAEHERDVKSLNEMIEAMEHQFAEFVPALKQAAESVSAVVPLEDSALFYEYSEFDSDSFAVKLGEETIAVANPTGKLRYDEAQVQLEVMEFEIAAQQAERQKHRKEYEELQAKLEQLSATKRLTN